MIRKTIPRGTWWRPKPLSEDDSARLKSAGVRTTLPQGHNARLRSEMIAAGDRIQTTLQCWLTPPKTKGTVITASSAAVRGPTGFYKYYTLKLDGYRDGLTHQLDERMIEPLRAGPSDDDIIPLGWTNS